ncbi:VanZ family protein [Dethiothermospora halolimnae]|uniref:VanZ family protein n=1 Tax=Dethiothermospora halolimnae TaxID=3114390 RepID=UPI003CCC439E
MEAYILPIKIAILTFPILAFLITLPFLIHQYRKYKYVNKLRSFILYSFFFYLLVAYYLVILPLPETRDICSFQRENTQYYQIEPFQFVDTFLDKTTLNIYDPSTYIDALRESVFLQAAFNAILLLPLGVYLRYYFKKGMIETIILSFLISLFFEITQITGLYAIYNCPYRLFDVDDLILNTFGGFIGYIIAPMFTFFLPKADKLDKDVNLKELEVGFIRRTLAFMIDWGIIGGILLLIIKILAVPKGIILYIITVFLYFIVGVYITNGKTIGKTFLRIKIKGENDRIKFKEVLKRYGILYYGVFGTNSILISGFVANYNSIAGIIIGFIGVLVNVMLFIHFILHLFEKKKRLFYEKLSKTRNIID